MRRILFIYSKFFKKIRYHSFKNSKIHSTSKIESGTTFYNSSMEKYSFCGYDCEIIHAEIGSFTSIANNVVIGGAKHPIDWVSTSPVFYSGRDSVTKKFSNFDLNETKKTIIGNDVWIGRSAIIISGVNIGNGAVIGAGAVVTKDVPPYAIFAGNPAKLIRFRFEDNIVIALKEIKWWNFDEKDIKILAKYIKYPEQYINYINNN